MRISIARAQRLISRIEGDVAKLAQRLETVVSYREDRRPEFRFEDTLEAWSAAKERLVRLKAARMSANVSTMIEYHGRELSLAEAVIRLAELKGEKALFKGLSIRTGSERVDDSRYSEDGRYLPAHREVSWLSGMSELGRDRRLTEIQDAFDELNGIVEAANHSTQFEWDDPAAASAGR